MDMVAQGKKKKEKLIKDYERMNFIRERELYKLYTRWGAAYIKEFKVTSQIRQERSKNQLQVQLSYGTFGAGIEIWLSVGVNQEWKELKFSMPNMSYVAKTKASTVEMENIRNAYMLSGKLLEHQEEVLAEMTKVLQKYLCEQNSIEKELASLSRKGV